MSKLNQRGSTVFVKVSEKIHFQLKQLAALENKFVCQLVSEMINEGIARRKRGTKSKTHSNNWVDQNGGIF